MENRTKWLVGITVANLACSALLALIVHEVLEAFAAFAAYVDTWPLLVLFPICIALSILGLWLARKARSNKARWFGYVFNGLPLLVPLLIVFFVGEIYIHMDRTRYIVPDGYQGYVYILRGVASGVPVEKGRWEVTYLIPSDGFLLTQAPVTGGLKAAKYYYKLNDGSLKQIPSNDATPSAGGPMVVAYPAVPESNGYGEISPSSSCNVEYEWFHLGPRSEKVAGPESAKLSAYLHAHPGVCATEPKGPDTERVVYSRVSGRLRPAVQ
jgi:hypothetical protein